MDDYNRVNGGMAKAVLEYLARNIVDDPDGVVVDLAEGHRGDVRLSLHVAPDDMGKVIGRRGRVAQAIRSRGAGRRGPGGRRGHRRHRRLSLTPPVPSSRSAGS